MPSMSIPYNAQFDAFVQFATSRGVSGGTALEGQQGADGSFTVKAKSKWDFSGNIGRSAASKAMNDDIRATFKRAVLDMFGVSDESGLPESVRQAMKFDDYGKGKPLTARRICAVQTAVQQHVDSMAQALRDKIAACGVTVDDRIERRIAKMMDACCGGTSVNKEAFNLMLENPLELLYGETAAGDVELFSKDTVERRSERIASNVENMQAATVDTPNLFVAVKPFLAAGGRVELTKPLTESMVYSVMTMDAEDLDALKLLAPDASASDVQKATAAFDKMLSKAMNETAPHHVKQDEATQRHYMLILSSMILARVFGGGESLRNAQTALEGIDARKLMRFSQDSARVYSSMAGEGKINGRMMQYLARRWERQVASMNQLKFFVDMCCDGPQAASRPIKPFPVKLNEIDAELATRVTKGVTEEMVREQEACVDGIVKGEGRGADALRFVFDRKLDETQASDSTHAVTTRCETSVRRTICRDIGKNCAALKQGPGMDAFTNMLGGLSLRISARSHIKGLGWSHEDQFKGSPSDAAATCDQLAAFITGNPRKKFSDLDAAHQNKVFVIMSFVSQLKQAAFEGPGLALNTAGDRERAEGNPQPAFSCISDPKTDVCSAQITMKDGVLEISFKGHKDVQQLQTRADDGSLVTSDVGAGSKQDVEFTFRITDAAVNRMAVKEDFQVAHGTSACTDFKMTAEIN